MAAYDEQQKLLKESEPTKRKAENGYDRWIWEQGLGHFTIFTILSSNLSLVNIFIAVWPFFCSYWLGHSNVTGDIALGPSLQENLPS